MTTLDGPDTAYTQRPLLMRNTFNSNRPSSAPGRAGKVYTNVALMPENTPLGQPATPSQQDWCTAADIAKSLFLIHSKKHQTIMEIGQITVYWAV